MYSMNPLTMYRQGGLLSDRAFDPMAMYRAYKAGLPFSMPQHSPIFQYLPPPLSTFNYAYQKPVDTGLLSVSKEAAPATTGYFTDAPVSKG